MQIKTPFTHSLANNQERLPSIRSLFPDQVLAQAEPRQEPLQQPYHESHALFSDAEDAAALQRAVTGMQAMSMLAPLEHEFDGQAGPCLNGSHLVSDSESWSSIGSPPRDGSTRQRRAASLARSRIGRVPSQGSRYSQMVRNRKGRKFENKWLRLVEKSLRRLSICPGDRQITSNQRNSGLDYTKCSNLETAVRYLLVFEPLHHHLERTAPELLRRLELCADHTMAELIAGLDTEVRSEQESA